jgi:hypothetical protein
VLAAGEVHSNSGECKSEDLIKFVSKLDPRPVLEQPLKSRSVHSENAMMPHTKGETDPPKKNHARSQIEKDK